MNALLILIGKLFSLASKTVNLGSGSTWPGHVALSFNKNFIKEILARNKDLKIILIAGTNGKTTTGKLIQTILMGNGKRVFQNESGANLLNGIASSLLLHSSILLTINYDYVVFEVDENTLPLALKELTPNYLILLNLFRDQLDRYGEVNTIVRKWKKALENLSKNTTLILNADDPQIAYLGKFRGGESVPPLRWNRIDTSVFYFGLDDKTLSQKSHQHAVDSTYCPNCNSKLYYNSIYYSHLGDWECKNCDFKRPKLDISKYSYYPLPGIYIRYNTLAAILVAKQIDVGQKHINSALHKFTPAFGRQETIRINGKRIQIFLSKNPTSFNESLRTITTLRAKNVLLVLNDRIPDGRDVSWIWDVDFEDYVNSFENIIVSGDRTYDMGLRIKYAIYNSELRIYENLNKAVQKLLREVKSGEIGYVLPTYSAMLEARMILTGRKLL